ncbi:MAG: prolyl oligopeptidase family serine peptidase [Fuerstiella sp.]
MPYQFKTLLTIPVLLAFALLSDSPAVAQPPSNEIRSALEQNLASLQRALSELTRKPDLQNRRGQALVADVSVFAKAVEWMLRHNEFPKKDYAGQAADVLAAGLSRASDLAAGQAPWELQTGMSVRGYVSQIDGSVQPYVLTLPEDVNPSAGKRWPLYVRLHGRANDMNEVNFIARHHDKPLPKGQTWIQLDVYGRGNNAYRWAGETDVFEALADVRRRFRIDDNRITLHGFSMGGAGAWHLGLHHPALWSSVGPGAGFVDFYRYQNQSEKRPEWQHQTLGIYDAIDYALNAANVPVCTYGGENDAQLVASTSVFEAAQQLGVEIKLLIGPGMGHKFHPDSFKEFMAFHEQKSAAGRHRGLERRNIRFTTRTLKYNRCDWLTIEEVGHVYQPSTVEANLRQDGNADITTENVAVLSVARDVAQSVFIDGDFLPCYEAADGLLPVVYYEKAGGGWTALNYDDSKSFLNNPDLNKRHDLQGPIDDAFMDSFLCVTGSSQTTATRHQQWTDWTLSRFRGEFDKWMRAQVPLVTDAELTKEQIRDNHLILFGDPSSNAVIAQVLPRLPITWTADSITVNGQSYSTDDHGLSMIFPNPLNPRKYVVLNSGHTFHEQDFKASNAWLFPRLGDIAVQKITAGDDGSFEEQTVWAANFNAGWKLPPESTAVLKE